MNKQKLLLDSFKSELGDSLLFSEIWNSQSKEDLVHLNSNPQYVNIVNSYITNLEKDLDTLGFPSFESYQITSLNMNSLHLLIKLDNEHFLGCLLDKSSLDITELINNSIPKIIEAYKILREDN